MAMATVAVASSVTFLVQHAENGELKLGGYLGTSHYARANANLRMRAGFDIPPFDYMVTWARDPEGDWELLADKYVQKRGNRERYQLCSLPDNWEKGTRLKRTFELVKKIEEETVMERKFKVGDRVRVLMETAGWGDVKEGDIGVVCRVSETGTVFVDFPAFSSWVGEERCFELVDEPKKTKSKGGESMTRQELFAEAMDRTYTSPEDRKLSYTAKAEKLAVLANEVGGCSKQALFALVEEVTGEKLPPAATSTAAALIGSLIVPTRCPNSHSYTIGKVVLVGLENDGKHHKCHRVGGEIGNWMSTDVEDSWRRPTYREALAFLEAVPETVLKSVLRK